jgi:hypothetical protein
VINVDAEFEHVNAAGPVRQARRRGVARLARRAFSGADA